MMVNRKVGLIGFEQPRFKLPYPLKGFLVCSQCGKPVTGSAPTGGSGKPHAAYHCSRCTIKRDGYRVSIDKEKAHSDFAERLDSLVPTEWALKAFKEIVIRRWDKEFREVQEERRTIDKELDKLEKRRNSLFDMLGDGAITDSKEFNRQIQRLEVQQVNLESERDQIKDTEVDKRKIVNEAAGQTTCLSLPATESSYLQMKGRNSSKNATF